jgi:hypothetical protein
MMVWASSDALARGWDASEYDVPEEATLGCTASSPEEVLLKSLIVLALGRRRSGVAKERGFTDYNNRTDYLFRVRPEKFRVHCYRNCRSASFNGTRSNSTMMGVWEVDDTVAADGRKFDVRLDTSFNVIDHRPD